jgi:hypothetical protein
MRDANEQVAYRTAFGNNDAVDRCVLVLSAFDPYDHKITEDKMRIRIPTLFACALVVFFTLNFAHTLLAQFPVGTFVKDAGKPEQMTVKVEACCGGGRRFSYSLKAGDPAFMVVEISLDGKDAPVMAGGKPSGETMSMRVVDARHFTGVLKMNGKPFGTAKGTISADGNTVTVETDVTSEAGGQPVGKQTEVWKRK